MIITRYLASHIHKGSLMVLLVLVSLSLFFLFIGELDDIGTGQYGLAQMFQYLLMRIPSFVVDFMPLAALLGCMLSLGNLASNSELIALQSSGYSIRQFIQSVGGAVLVLAILSFLIGNYIVPVSETRAKEFRQSSVKSNVSMHSRQGIWIKDGNNIIYIGKLYPDGNAINIQINHLDDAGQLVKTIYAAKAISHTDGWMLFNVKSSQLSSESISVETEKQLLYKGNLSDQLLESLAVNPQQMSVTDLNTYISFLKDNNLSSSAESLSFWRKLYAPVSIIVMGLLAIPFVIGSQRQSNTGQRLMMGILLGLLYVVLNRLLIQMGEQLRVPAYINALIPTFLFLLGTVWLIRKKINSNQS